MLKLYMFIVMSEENWLACEPAWHRSELIYKKKSSRELIYEKNSSHELIHEKISSYELIDEKISSYQYTFSWNTNFKTRRYYLIVNLFKRRNLLINFVMRRHQIVDLFVRRNYLQACQAPICIHDTSQYL